MTYVKIKGQNINQLLLYEDLFIFYALTWPDFWKMLKRQKKAHLKKKNLWTSILRMLRREIVQIVARTRKWGGSHSTPPWVLKAEVYTVQYTVPRACTGIYLGGGGGKKVFTHINLVFFSYVAKHRPGKYLNNPFFKELFIFKLKNKIQKKLWIYIIILIILIISIPLF